MYDDAKLPDKPKNALGFAKDIPPAEMEALLLKSYTVDDEALRALANERAQTVKVWLTDTGRHRAGADVPRRVEAHRGRRQGRRRPTRVDFSLK